MTKDHLAAMIGESVRAHGARPAMRFKKAGAWITLSYAELGARIRAVARGLLEAGIAEGDAVGIFARNAPEWSIADFAILSVRAVSVPIYPTSTAQQAEYVVRDAGLKLLFVGDQVQHDMVRPLVGSGSGLRRVVVLDPRARIAGEGAVHFEDFSPLSSPAPRGEGSAGTSPLSSPAPRGEGSAGTSPLPGSAPRGGGSAGTRG
jgi:long-chain acyl-CoA synthetase